MILTLTGLLIACSKPIAILGNGDVVSASGDRDCSLEDFHNGAQNCRENLVAGEYRETYTAIPRSGWMFEGWDNYCQESIGNTCSFDFSGQEVRPFWGGVARPLVARFARPGCTPATGVDLYDVSSYDSCNAPDDDLEGVWMLLSSSITSRWELRERSLMRVSRNEMGSMTLEMCNAIPTFLGERPDTFFFEEDADSVVVYDETPRRNIRLSFLSNTRMLGTYLDGDGPSIVSGSIEAVKVNGGASAFPSTVNLDYRNTSEGLGSTDPNLEEAYTADGLEVQCFRQWKGIVNPGYRQIPVEVLNVRLNAETPNGGNVIAIGSALPDGEAGQTEISLRVQPTNLRFREEEDGFTYGTYERNDASGVVYRTGMVSSRKPAVFFDTVIVLNW